MLNDIDVIICHYTGDLVFKCIDSLTADRKAGAKVSVASSLRDHYDGVNWYMIERNEPTYKRNYVTLMSDREYLCFLDDDVEVTSECLRTMRDYLEDNPIVGMVYALLYQKDGTIDTAGSWLTPTGFLYEDYTYPKINRRVLSAKSACCMVRRKVFESVGGFDEDFVIYGEETDLSWRIWHKGWQVWLLRDAVAYHKFGGEKDDSFYVKYFIHFHGSKNYLMLLQKNLHTRRFTVLICNFCAWFCIATAFIFKNVKVSKWIFQGLWYNIRNFRHIWKKRQAIEHTVDEGKFWYNPGWKYYVGRAKDYLTHQLHRKVS